MRIIIELLLLNSFYIIGIYKASHFEYISEDDPEFGAIEKSKMILWKLRHLSLQYFGRFYSKPLFTCPACMASFHSSYIFWPAVIYLYGFHYQFIFCYLLYVGILAGVNYILNELIDLIEALHDYLITH